MRARPEAVEHELIPPPARTGVQFPALDGLRAVGALAVLTTHVAFWSGDYLGNGVVGSLLARLDVGVAIFFVLSGFLLSRPWLVRAADGRRAPAAPAYLWKRAVRVFPVYLVTAVVALVLIEDNGDLGISDWLGTLLLLDTYTRDSLPAGLTHMWSLAVEVAFYLLLPLLMLVLVGRRQRLRPRRVLAGLAAMAAVTVWWHLDGASRAGELGTGIPLQWLPAYLLWFALGIGLALVQLLHERGHGSGVTAPVVSLAHQPGSCWVLAGGLMLVAATPIAGPTMFDAPSPGESLAKCVLYGLVGLLLVLTGVFVDESGTTRAVLGHPVVRRLGWISYGIFCLHLPVLHLVMWATPWELFGGNFAGLWLLTTAGALLAAELAYRLVERPAQRGRRLVVDPATTRGSRAESSSAATGTSTR